MSVAAASITNPPPRPRIIPKLGNRFELAEDYQYTWKAEGRTRRITVPAGFTCDMASVPRPVWALISPFDLGTAALLHDWVYNQKGTLGGSFHLRAGEEWVRADDEVLDPKWTRKEADRLFGRVMREQGVARWRRRAAFLAVRLFGGGVWKD